ncbi:MFS transporter [Kitasatospora viridis]|uniref:MFS transporter n=1 Tax=Kitasatospora viridis TaxID=281105 RepID=A0A561UGY8_9ACTN|nr:MFS transporter [Kitasatospora viridis]
MIDTLRRRLLLPVILLATFMASFDYMVVNVAAPSLAHDLHAGQAALELVVGGYGFSYAAGLITGGKLGDLFGHRRVFLLGVGAFTVASLLCGLAGSPGQLVAARLLQGLAAAAMAPQVLALITRLLPGEQRARALGWFGVALGTGGIAGQVLGGLLLQADPFGLGWRVIFLVNLPVGVGTVAAATRLLPRPVRTAEPVQPQPVAARSGGRTALADPPAPAAAVAPPTRPRLDLPGVLGLAASLALALVPLVLGREAGWPLWSWLSLAAAAPALAATLSWERRLARTGREPLLDLALFRGRTFSTGLLINACVLAAIGSQLFTTTLLLQAGLGLDSRAAGLEFLPLGLTTMAASLLGRRLIARFGRRVLVAGTLLSTAAAVLLALTLELSGGGVRPVELIAPLALTGFGNGLTLPALMAAVLATVAPARIGAASGVLTTTQQFAGASGVAAVGAVFFATLGTAGSPGAYAAAAASAAWVIAALMAAATVLVGVLLRPGRS